MSKIELDVPFVPSVPEKVKKMVKMADIKPGERAADLGCGDGRVVIALAQAGAEVHGYEIEPERVQLSRHNISNAGVSDRAFAHLADFWKINLSPYDVVIVYGITSIMAQLEQKLTEELRPGARVVSNSFRFPNWKPDVADHQTYLYIKK